MASRMNSKESLYKKRTPGMANREVRAKLKAQQSKTKRDDLLASKRRIPLSIIQEEKQSPKPKKATREQESDLRLEKLREWKKARDEAKKRSQQAKKPTVAKPKTQNNIFNPKPWVSTTTNSLFGKSKPLQKSEKPVTKPVPKPAAVKTSRPAVKSTRSAISVPTTKSIVPKTKPTAKSTIPKTKPTTKPTTVTSKAPKKLPVKPKENTSKAVKLRPQTRSMTKSVVSKVKAESMKSCSTKIRTNSGSKSNKSPPTKLSKRTVTTRSVSKVTTKDTVEMMDITVEVSNPAPEDESLPPQVTPPRTRRYDPVHPSPLLRSHSASAKRRETQLFLGPPPVTDPVWLPGQTSTMGFVQPDFDDAFGSFSPFKFGGSDNFQFTFRKQLSPTMDSLEDDSIQIPVTPEARIVRRSVGSARKSLLKRNISMDEGAMIVEVVSEGASGEETETGAPALEDGPPEATEPPQVDIVYFRKLHSDVVASLSSLCDMWEGKTAALEDDQSDQNMEEALGQLRTTVCQGRLLMRKKLAQYLGLVGIAETQSGERETTSEDLQGFWDMVYFQVEDVYKKFRDLEALEKNGWTVKVPTPKKRKVTKKRVAKKVATTTASCAEENERMQAAREKREAQRNKLKEMRMAAKRAREEATIVQEEEGVFTTPKKSRIDELSSPKSGSAYKHGRRRSLRVRNRSIFSPCSTEKTPRGDAPCNDIPIAPLISFD